MIACRPAEVAQGGNPASTSSSSGSCSCRMLSKLCNPQGGYYMSQTISFLGAVVALGVIASGVSAREPPCYHPVRIGPGVESVTATMTVTRNGSCSYQSLENSTVVTAPRNGQLRTANYFVYYTPNPNFSGSDSFVVSGSLPQPAARQAGSRSSGPTRVSITVRVTVQ